MTDPGRRSRFAVAIVLALAVSIVVGCAAAPSGSSRPSDTASASPGALDGAPVVEFASTVDVLAASGIGVYEQPDSTDPLKPIAEPASPLKLLRFQVDQLVAHANAGMGTAAATIDEATETDGQGKLPMSYVLAGYAATATTPGGLETKRLLGDQDLDQPDGLLFPDLAIVLYVGEVTSAGAKLGGTSALPLAGQLAAVERPGHAPPAALAAFSPCGAFGDFMSTVFQKIESAILSIIPDIPFVKAGIAWALGKAIDAGKLALEQAQKLIPFFEPIKQAIGLLALGMTVKSVLQPWSIRLTSDHDKAHYSVGAQVTEVTVKGTIDDGGGHLPKVVLDCLAIVDKSITDIHGGAKDSPVDWKFAFGAEHVATFEALEKKLSDSKQTTFRFVMTDEPQRFHDDGPIVTNPMYIQLTVRRQDVATLKARLDKFARGIVQPAIFDALVGHFGNPLDGLVKLMTPTAQRRVIAEHHLAPTPTPTAPPTTLPTPPVKPSPGQNNEFCRRYKALREWAKNPDYPELSQEWGAYVANAYAEMQPFAPPDIAPGLEHVVQAYALYGNAPEPANVPLAGPDAVYIGETIVAIHQYCGIPLEG
jgi:hypothetical protein